MRSIWAIPVLASILILGALGLSTQSQAATINDNVIVGPGDTLTLDGDSVNGNIELNGGSLDIFGSTINGNIIAENCIGENSIEDTSVTGNIILQACNDITTSGNFIDGNVEVKDSDNVVISENTVNGNIKIENTPDCNVFDNTVNGNLEIGDCSTEPDELPTICEGTIRGGTFGNVEVPAGASCTMRDVTITGSLTSDGAVTVFILDSEIAGDVNIQNPTQRFFYTLKRYLLILEMVVQLLVLVLGLAHSYE